MNTHIRCMIFNTIVRRTIDARRDASMILCDTIRCTFMIVHAGCICAQHV